jgi:hypothetical protein
VKRDTRQTTLDVSEALWERDNRITELEKEVRALRGRRAEGVVLIGGPRHGVIEPVYIGDRDAPRSIDVLIPPDPVVARRYTATELSTTTVRIGTYQLERLMTYDGTRWVGVWKGER